ncbi:MAG: hypothetical protein JWP61_2410 [Friedmanniella sp.]|nr:hypothetical protein [Friedmanniella sp.]
MSDDQPVVTPSESLGPQDRTVRSRGGRLVHVGSQEGPPPPVLLLGGCGVPFYVWVPVVAQLADLTVVRMDRPGLVQTPWPGRLPTLAEEVATLVALVEELGTPVVAVGHSMAGPHIEALARQRPDLVAGMVLVDASVEWEPRPPKSGRLWLQTARAAQQALRLRPFAELGPLADRVLVSAQSRRRRVFGPRSDLADQTYRSPDAVASVVAEQAAYDQQIWDLAEVRRQTTWSGIPTVVLTADDQGSGTWVACQRRLAESLGGRHVVLEDSGHLMMIDRPEVVVDAIRALLPDNGGHG